MLQIVDFLCFLAFLEFASVPLGAVPRTKTLTNDQKGHQQQNPGWGMMWHKQQAELANQIHQRGLHSPPIAQGTRTTPTDMPPPTFKMESNTSVVISAGQTSYLHCLVENLGDRSVSWIRRSDLMVLTIGEIAYTQDKRFTPIHEHGSEVWMLKITSPEVDDTGEYECQLSYHEDEEERYSLAFSLRVLNSRAYIQDDRDLHVEKGSQLRLSCSILAASTSPDYVLWYHDGKVLNYSPSVDILTDTSQATSTSSDLAAQQPMAVTQADMKRQRLKDSEMAAGDKNKANDELDLHHNNGGVVSRLSIDNVRRSLHSGNYTCEPSNARAASITVHIVDDESGPAAMQHGNGSKGLASILPLGLQGQLGLIWMLVTFCR